MDPRQALHTAIQTTGRMATVLVMALVVLAAVPGQAQDGAKQVVHLYFADARKPFLVDESRVMIAHGDAARFGRQIIEALIAGPAGEKIATIPAGTALRSFFLLPDGTAVVDFSAELRENHPGGCRQEQLTLFSIVNSLVLNLPAVDRVRILIAGDETETLAGHVALAYPLTADLLLTR